MILGKDLFFSPVMLLQLHISQEVKRVLNEQFKELPSEKVFVGINSSLLLAGEYLFYKVYNLNDKTKQPSEISKIAYVELISMDKDVVFKHKIRLVKSQGQGDFFVPTTVPSGNFKLIAYTRWMKNGSVDLFFQEDISIINPYQSNQDAVLPDGIKKETINELAAATEIKNDKRFILSTDKKSYTTRSKVLLSVQNFRGASGYGNYTVSVRKKEAMNETIKHTPESFNEWHQKQALNTTSFYKNIPFVPELKGELIVGQLRTKDNSPVNNLNVAVSIPGEDFQLKVVKTDSVGIFYVNIDKYYTEAFAIFQVLGNAEDVYTIKIIQDPPIDYSSLKFKKYYIHPKMEEAIIRRSVHNQIENAYFAVKPDTIRLDVLNDPYGGSYVETIHLEEYTRCKTLKETIIELVPNVWTKKNKEGEFVFKVRSFDETYEESEFDALVFIEGVLIPKPTDIMDFDTRTVVRVNTVREKYRLGGKYYFGMVNIKTNEGDYFEKIGSGLTTIALTSPRPLKNYFTQSYTIDSKPNIPDFRNQLFWEPTISMEGKELDLSFYTSEVTGEYEVKLEGFSIYGRPVIIRETFTVN